MWKAQQEDNAKRVEMEAARAKKNKNMQPRKGRNILRVCNDERA
jgi:hypothetical protein